MNPAPDSKGRHQLLGQGLEDLTGVFSIEEFIQALVEQHSGRDPRGLAALILIRSDII